MKNPKELFKDLTLIGKVASPVIMPIYYVTSVALIVFGIIFYGIYAAWCDGDD